MKLLEGLNLRTLFDVKAERIKSKPDILNPEMTKMNGETTFWSQTFIKLLPA